MVVIRRPPALAQALASFPNGPVIRARTRPGTAAFRPMRSGSFLRTRLVPVGEQWLLSAVSQILAARSRDALYRAAAQLSLRCPAWVFRNPEKLARGWELQRQDRADFVEFFGADMVCQPSRPRSSPPARGSSLAGGNALGALVVVLARAGILPTRSANSSITWCRRGRGRLGVGRRRWTRLGRIEGISEHGGGAGVRSRWSRRGGG